MELFVHQCITDDLNIEVYEVFKCLLQHVQF